MKRILKRKKKRIYVYQKMVDEIRNEIEKGRLLPGQWLAGENAIAERYKISRMSVRSGLKVLKSEGLVESTAGMGIRVIGFSGKQMEHVMLVFPFERTVGVPISQYYLSLINTIRNRLAENDLPMKIFFHEPDKNEEKLWKHISFPKNMGVILMAETTPSAIPEMKNIYGPIVQVDHRIPSLNRDSVELDSMHAGALAIDYLHKLGCRKPIYIGWRKEGELDPLKFLGMKECAEKRGVEIRSELVIQTGQNESEACNAMTTIIQSGNSFDGLIAYSNPQANGAMKALHQAGIECPVVSLGSCFDKINDAPFAQIVPDLDAMALKAIECLLSRYKNDSDPPNAYYVKPSIKAPGD